MLGEEGTWLCNEGTVRQRLSRRRCTVNRMRTGAVRVLLSPCRMLGYGAACCLWLCIRLELEVRGGRHEPRRSKSCANAQHSSIGLYGRAIYDLALGDRDAFAQHQLL